MYTGLALLQLSSFHRSPVVWRTAQKQDLANQITTTGCHCPGHHGEGLARTTLRALQQNSSTNANRSNILGLFPMGAN